MNDMDQNRNNPEAHDLTPPDRAAAGDVSTTGVSTHDVVEDPAAHGPAGQDAHGTHGTVTTTGHGTTAGHGTTGGHGGHGDDDASEVSTLVPTNWKQLILPALILLLVGILVAGPLFGAFATRPAAPVETPNENTNPGAPTATTVHEGGVIQPATGTSIPSQASTGAVETVSTGTPALLALNPSSIATRTAVAVAGEQGEVARIPVQLEVAGTSFVVKPGNNLLPDWKPSQDVGIATWIEGTVANHIMYVPYNAENAALFQSVKTGSPLSVTMNTGQVFIFAVTRSERAANGPATADGQFTVTTAMRQDHAGVTLFLIGDPAADRAVVQADFTGTIQ